MSKVLAGAMKGALTKILTSMLSERLIMEVILILLRRLVASTSNTLDDKILAAYEAHLAGGKNGEAA
jgi:hypothetical protein